MKTSKLGLLTVGFLFACSGSKLQLGEGDGGGMGGESGAGSGGTVRGGGGSGTTGGSKATGGSRATGGAGGTDSGLPDHFTALTLVVSGGFGPHWPDLSTVQCQPLVYENTFTVDAASRSYSWDVCTELNPDATYIEKGTRTLDELEFATVLKAFRALTAPSQACGADKPMITLDAEVDGGTLLLQDEFYSCNGETGRRFVGNIDELASALRSLKMKPLPEPNQLTLRVAGGFTAIADPSSECQYSSYENTYAVDFSAAQFRYSLCRPSSVPDVAMIVAGERALEADEAAAVRAAYSGLELGASGTCGADAAAMTLEASDDHDTLLYLDDFYSCAPPAEPGSFVKNMDAVWQALAPLAPRE
jgi:hypothetical protein